MGTRPLPPTPRPAIMHRCPWANPKNPLYVTYHDQEWGVPCHDEARMVEMLLLEGAQAGLSWETVLNKRANYRQAFDDWAVDRVAAYDADKVAGLLTNPGIIRNRLKVAAAINNARLILQMHAKGETLCDFFWQFVDGQPIHNHHASYRDAPGRTPLSDQISKTLQQRGFKFVGSTIIYAHMQSVGLVNDHETACFRHPEIRALSP